MSLHHVTCEPFLVFSPPLVWPLFPSPPFPTEADFLRVGWKGSQVSVWTFSLWPMRNYEMVLNRKVIRSILYCQLFSYIEPGLSIRHIWDIFIGKWAGFPWQLLVCGEHSTWSFSPTMPSWFWRLCFDRYFWLSVVFSIGFSGGEQEETTLLGWQCFFTSPKNLVSCFIFMSLSFPYTHKHSSCSIR